MGGRSSVLLPWPGTDGCRRGNHGVGAGRCRDLAAGRDAEGRRDADRAARRQGNRLSRERRPQPLGGLPSRLQVGLREHEQELLAAVAADDIGGPQGGPERHGGGAQHRVPGEVTVGVVDALEEVEVADDHGQGAVEADRAGQLLAQPLVHGPVVEQPGEAVVAGELLQALGETGVVEHHREVGQQPLDEVSRDRLELLEVAGQHRQHAGGGGEGEGEEDEVRELEVPFDLLAGAGDPGVDGGARIDRHRSQHRRGRALHHLEWKRLGDQRGG